MKPQCNDVQYDIWRDSLLRYIGYANEVGEAFRPIYPRFVGPSYVIAFSYVGCDTIDKMIKSYKKGASNSTTIKQGVDAFLWQTLASVLIPGKTIHFITAAASNFTSSGYGKRSLPLLAIKWGPTCVGLSSIPFIVHPIDSFVDFFMDKTYRTYV